MYVETLQERQVPRITKRILAEAGLPTTGMTKVLLGSILSDEIGSSIQTSANGHWVVDIKEDTEMFASKVARDDVAAKSHLLTERLIRGLLGDHYHNVVKKVCDPTGVNLLEIHLRPELPEWLN